MDDQTVIDNSTISEPGCFQVAPQSSSMRVDSTASTGSMDEGRRATPVEGTPQSLLPPPNILTECIDLFFQYCHKQPLWLFNRQDLALPDQCCPEVILGVLTLSLRYSKNSFFEGQADRICKEYAEAARVRIMDQIVKGKIKLSTIQSLCLLAMGNMLGKSTVCKFYPCFAYYSV